MAENDTKEHTKYSEFSEINTLQRNIMLFIDWWVHNEKSCTPQKEIILAMRIKGTKSFTTINAINSLLKKGYIRRAEIISNKTSYVQLRRV